MFLYILNMLNFKRVALIPTEIQSDEAKNSGSIPSPHPVHSFARILKWPSFRILWSDLEKQIQGAQLDAQMHLHIKFHENPALKKTLSKHLLQINSFEVRKKM